MYTRFSIFLLLLAVDSMAQGHRIDSLKKALPFLEAREKVDCLNGIVEQYTYFVIHSDSALKYERMAREEAKKSGYVTGEGYSVALYSEIQGRLLGNIVAMERSARQAIQLLEKSGDAKKSSFAYRMLGLSMIWQGLHDSAAVHLEKAKQLAISAGDQRQLGWASQVQGVDHFKSGKFWKAFEYFMEGQRIGKETGDSMLVSASLSLIAMSFNYVDDPRRALDYHFEGRRYAIPGFLLLYPFLEDMGHAYLKLKMYDSAIYFQELHRQNINLVTSDPVVRKRFSVWLYPDFYSDVELAQSQYDKLIARLEPMLAQQEVKQDVLPLMHSYLFLGKAYAGKKAYAAALQSGHSLLKQAKKSGNAFFMKEGYQLMASLFDQLKQSDSAYHYFKNYTAIRDSMETAQFTARSTLYLAASAAENRIRLLEKDKEISQQQLALNRKELQKQGQLKNFLVGGLLLLFLFSFLVVRNIILKRKNEKLRGEQDSMALKRKALELEMQALRAQMNPHFIFNCLSAIDNLVQTSQADKATIYLSRFAKLIRGVLDSSKNNLVPFQNDFETMKLYLEMEQFRCNNKFSYRLKADDDLLKGDYKVPPLIVQPFIENAIHHGLLNKQGNDRELQVTAKLQDEKIIYSVTDNGIGRKRAGILKERNRPGQKSYGIDITRERISLHNRQSMSEGLLITDLEEEGHPSGTRAVVTIICADS